jgi:hypothetical protein
MTDTNKKLDIPESNDPSSTYYRSLKKIGYVLVLYIVLVLITFFIHKIFYENSIPLLFYIVYIGTLLFIIPLIGMIDIYLFNNILVGLSIAIGLQLIYPDSLIGMGSSIIDKLKMNK